VVGDGEWADGIEGGGIKKAPERGALRGL